MGKTVLYPNLVAELARNGITITALAEKLGMTRTNLYKKLDGTTNFLLRDLIAIQKILYEADSSGDYSLDYLFGGATTN